MSLGYVLANTLVTDFLRYRRSSALLFVALATPVAAHFMVPVTESSYSVLLVNDAAPVLTPAVLGLELGMITATVLTPLAYIFLRAGPTSRRPWQVTDPLPYSRMLVALGRWAADTAALWLLLIGLSIAGAILMFLRAGATLDGFPGDFTSMAACLWLTAAPALALTAGVRALLAAPRATRGWGGDVAFFFIWVFSLSLPVVFTAASGAITDPSPFLDPFGMIYPVVNAVDVPVTDLAIGGGPPTQATIAFDALGGTVTWPFVGSRLLWLAVAVILAAVAGGLYQSHRASGAAAHEGAGQARPAALAPIRAPAVPARPALVPWGALLLSHLSLLLRPRWLAALIALTALGGVAAPYRDVIGPALLLLATFPMSSAAARWERGDLPAFLATAVSSATERRGAGLGAAVLVGLLAHLPSAVTALTSDEGHLLVHMAFITAGVPALCLLGAVLTKGAVAARLILLIIWYGYFASAGA